MKRLSACLALTLLLPLLTFRVSAANFVPSVERKAAPTVSAVTDDSGQAVAAFIMNEYNEEVVGVPFGDLIVTPVAEAQEADQDIRTNLLDAYEQIHSTASLDTLAPELDQVVKSLADQVDVEDLVVRDLFDVTVRGTYEEYLAVEGNSIAITFALGLKSDALLIVLHHLPGEEWEVIPESRIVRHDNGDVTITFSSLSPVAFVVDALEVTVPLDAPDSPQTGESAASHGAGVLAAMFAGAAAALFLSGYRKGPHR